MIIRLESVRRVDSGKSVIKKMIVLSNLVNAIVSSKQTLGVVDEVFNFKIGGIVYRFVYLAEVRDRYSLTKIFGWIHHHFARFVYNHNAYIFWLGKVFFFFFFECWWGTRMPRILMGVCELWRWWLLKLLWNFGDWIVCRNFEFVNVFIFNRFEFSFPLNLKLHPSNFQS